MRNRPSTSKKRQRRRATSFSRVMVFWCGSIRSSRAEGAFNSMRCCVDVASHGIWVSTHPDVTQKMGVKEVLDGLAHRARRARRLARRRGPLVQSRQGNAQLSADPTDYRFPLAVYEPFA